MEWSRKTKIVEARYQNQVKQPKSSGRRHTREEWIEKYNELACDKDELEKQLADLQRNYDQLRSEYDGLR